MRRFRWLLIIGMTIALFFLAAKFSSLPTSSSLQAQTLRSNQPTPAKGTTVPAQIIPCIPAEGALFELLGTAKANDSTYHLLAIYEFANEKSSDRWDVLIQVDEVGCLLLHHLGSGLKPLGQYMPVALARELELQRYQHWISKVGGKEQFQKQFTARVSDPKVPHYLSSEQMWALKQLGISIPKAYKPMNAGSL